ncbi:ADP-ribosylglycohydrolase family protein [uncultured Rikenella sp.]|uniref:ADP-ribosylglycohydrolase family protein n=1 Tax=uncultured Rikenella sp. TaxID=368003 RepID=UPI0025EAB243|nr:ADP-ribosylglycohydrolase family protein [uncultured Rikenella sp.]
MIGAIIGDIAGSCYEFDNTTDYHFPIFSTDKNYTDDTICTIAVADAILNQQDYRTSMRAWCRRYPHPMGAYGNYFFDWVMRPDSYPYHSFGNGSAMRVSPVAWLFDNEQDVSVQAELSAAITHNHPEGIKGAVAVAVAIFRMRTAINKTSAIFESVAKEFYGDAAFSNLPERGFFDVTCQGCVPLALYLASLATSFEDAVRRAVVYGGDTDTVGAIVGSLAEARYEIPDEMVSNAKSYLPRDMLEVVHRFESRRK